MNPVDQSGRLVDALRAGDGFGRGKDDVEVIETHISWVLLAGEFAYKLKKPLRFDFLDFSTLENRRFYCEEEVRLNRRFAPDLYLGVVEVGGDPGHPVIGGAGEVLDYAVKMRRFAQEELLSDMARRGELGSEQIDALARVLAGFHGACARSDADHDFGRADDIHFWVKDNFAETTPLLIDDADREALRELEEWCARAFERIKEVLEERRGEGFVRECHGDLHLRNIVWHDGKPTLFDCIEFNEAFRWIDVMSEVAFLVMDLDDRGLPALAHRGLNRYLQATGDYAGVTVLDYYLVYRAMVRAKVAAIRIREGHLQEGQAEALWKEYRSYVDLAMTYTKRPAPVLVLMHGVSGTGKSSLAERLVEEAGLIQVRSDIERKRLFGFGGMERTGSEFGKGVYSAGADTSVYARLHEIARGLLAAGYSVIVDATFLKRAQRAPFFELAREMDVPAVLLDLSAPVEILRERVRVRMDAGRDPSEATGEVLEHQLQGREQFEGCEEAVRVAIDSSAPIEVGAVIAALEGVANRDQARRPEPKT